MSAPMVLYTYDDGIAHLTLNRPERRNALSSEMMEDLLRRLDEVRNDSDVRVVVLAADGPVFSSGHDLRELADSDREDQALVFKQCTELMEAIRLMPKPVIAQVQGLATAAGCQLVATCDLAVASEDSAFATPGVDIGVFCTTPAVALSRAVPTKMAMHMLLTGEPISAQEALASGLVNRVVPAAELEDATLVLARKLVSSPVSTVATGKTAFYKQVSLSVPEAYSMAQQVMVDSLQHPEGREGVSAFLEKRTPNWRS